MQENEWKYKDTTIMSNSQVGVVDDIANQRYLPGCILEKTLRTPHGVYAGRVDTVTVLSATNPFKPKEKENAEGAEKNYRVVVIDFNPKEETAWLDYSAKVLQPHELCTVGHLRVRQLFDSFGKADLVRKYLESKFVRFCLSQQLPSDKEGDECFSCVPVFDIPEDWQNEKLTDDVFAKKLYEVLGLTDEEIAFIESTIKPMA